MKTLIALAVSTAAFVSTQANAAANAVSDIIVICACGDGYCDCLIIIIN